MTSGARDLVAHVHAGRIGSTTALAAELEALLVPLNRAAARRVLGRLVREHVRALGSAPASASFEDAEQRPSSRDVSEPVARADDTHPDGAFEAFPAIPPPPRLGSLASLATTTTSAVDTEPDAPLMRAGDTDDLPSAGATQRDRATRDNRSARTRRSSTGRRVVLTCVALLVLTALVFILYRLTALASAPDACCVPALRVAQ
jgi:hypothetical protein